MSKDQEPSKIGQFYTVPQLAKALGIDQEKILKWIRKGDLLAINVAQIATGRPRWRIPYEAWETFQKVRSNRAYLPAPRPPRRRRPPDVIQYY